MMTQGHDRGVLKSTERGKCPGHDNYLRAAPTDLEQIASRARGIESWRDRLFLHEKEQRAVTAGQKNEKPEGGKVVEKELIEPPLHQAPPRKM